MPIENNIIFNRYNSQTRFYNTNIGSLSLKGNVGERMQTKSEVEVYWYVEPNTFSIFENGGRIVLNDTSNFNASGFFQSDVIEIRFGFGVTGQNAIGNVINVSGDGKTIFTDINTLTDGLYTDTDLVTPNLFQCLITGLTSLENLIYRYNYIDNDVVTGDYNNVITGDTQEWQVKDITAVATNGNSVGKNRWRHEDDFLRCTKLTDKQLPVTRDVDFGGVGGVVPIAVQNFLVEHRSSILPYYQNGELNNFFNLETVPSLEGLASYKYIFSMTFKNNIKDANETKNVEFIEELGSVGWFNENFNNNDSQYSISPASLSYTDQDLNIVNGINLNGVTSVQVTILSDEGTLTGSQNYTIMHSYLPQETILTDDYYNKNYIYETVNKGSVGNYISNISESLTSPNELIINFDIDLSNENIKDGEYYLLSIMLDDDTLNAELSDRVNLLIDVNRYNKNNDVEGLVYDIDSFAYTHYTDDLYTESKGWVQDSVEISFTYKQIPFAYTNKANIQLVAWKDGTEDYFVIQDYNMFTDNLLLTSSNGYQYTANTPSIDIDQDDNLISAPSSSIKNQTLQNYNPQTYDDNCDLESSVSSGSVIGFSFFYLRLKTRYKWHDWLKLDVAPNIFINNNKENNGLNQNPSNYSLQQGYSLKWILNLDVVTDVNGEDVTTKYIHKTDVELLDFGVNSNENWELSTVITKTLDGDVNTDCNLLSEEDMVIEMSFVNLDGSGFDLSDYQSSMRIEPKNPSDEFQTIELASDNSNVFSSFNQTNPSYVFDNPVGYPLNGQDVPNLLTMTKVASNIVLTAILKKNTNYLNQDLYTITGRIGLKDQSAEIIAGQFTDDFNDDFFI